MLNKGDVLDGKYHIIEYIGRGRWGRVLLAENLRIGNRWAVKEISLKSDVRVNLQAEPEILKMLNHRSLPRIIDVIRSDDFIYIIEDYFEGRNLRELINHRDLCTEDNVINWGRQLCEILIYLHNIKPNPIIYRDMKPGNIIVDTDLNVKLIDFGIAKEFRSDQDSDSTFIGTIGYAAPEQYSIGSRADERTDIYGLGVTLYHVLTGINPGLNPQKIVPLREVDGSFSAAIEKVIIKCTQQNPDDRHQSAQELLSDLENINSVKGKLIAGSFLARLKKMLQKPNRKRALLADKLMGTAVIAVGGTDRGVGCTYISIALASFLSRQNCKVAVVERNENPVLSALSDESSCSGCGTGYFGKNGIHFYWQNFYNSDELITKALRGGYDFLVIDLGRLTPENMQAYKNTNSAGSKEIADLLGGTRNPGYEEMFRANIPILVSGCAEWQLKDLTPSLHDAVVHNWPLFFSIPDRKVFEEIKSQLKISSFATAFSPDPFLPNSHQDSVFAQVIQGALARKNEQRKFLF